MSGDNYAQADLSLLLPLRPGQRVAVLGAAPGLVEALVDAQTIPQLILPRLDGPLAASYVYQATAHNQPLPFPSASFDHIFLPRLTHNQANWLPREVVRVLKPGGWMFLGLRNSQALQRWRRRRPARPAHSLSDVRHTLSRGGLLVKHCYGVRDNLDYPTYVVPLEEAGVVRHFFARMYVPHSTLAAIIQRCSPLLIILGLQRLLFDDLVLIARRPTEQAELLCCQVC